MAVLNHHIVAASDKQATALFFADILGLEQPVSLGPFAVLRVSYWSDPHRSDPGNINRWDDGRGVYFPDPNGHLLEIITPPTEAEARQPNTPTRSSPHQYRTRPTRRSAAQRTAHSAQQVSPSALVVHTGQNDGIRAHRGRRILPALLAIPLWELLRRSVSRTVPAGPSAPRTRARNPRCEYRRAIRRVGGPPPRLPPGRGRHRTEPSGAWPKKPLQPRDCPYCSQRSGWY